MNPVAQKNQEEQHQQCEHKQRASCLHGGGAGKVCHVVLQLLQSINVTI